MPRPILSHIDLRVRDRRRSTEFYDALLLGLGLVRVENDEWTSYYDKEREAGPLGYEWFGFTEDPTVTPNANRIAFVAATYDEVDRAGEALHRIGASNIEGPGFDEGPGYYAVFFEDPDGHRLEVCCRTQ